MIFLVANTLCFSLSFVTVLIEFVFCCFSSACLRLGLHSLRAGLWVIAPVPSELPASCLSGQRMPSGCLWRCCSESICERWASGEKTGTRQEESNILRKPQLFKAGIIHHLLGTICHVFLKHLLCAGPCVGQWRDTAELRELTGSSGTLIWKVQGCNGY